MVSKDIQKAVDEIRRHFTNVPDNQPFKHSMLMGLDFYRALLKHPEGMKLTDEECEAIVDRLFKGEAIELENGMVDRLNSDGLVYRGFL